MSGARRSRFPPTGAPGSSGRSRRSATSTRTRASWTKRQVAGVTWQGYRDGDSDIFLQFHDGSSWSHEIQVSDHPANDWEPRIAVDRQGSAAVVWDSYRNGNYDVLLRRFDGGELDPLEPVAATEKFEGRASVAVDLDGRVWVAWGEGAATWGKDSGPTTDPRWIGRGRELWIRWINQSSVYCVGSDITAPGGADHCIDADGRCRRRGRSGCRSGRTGPASGTSRRCCGPTSKPSTMSAWSSATSAVSRAKPVRPALEAPD